MEQFLQRENIQENTESPDLEKKASVISKVSEDAVTEQKLRRPRSRSFIKSLKSADDAADSEVPLTKTLPLNNMLLGILAPCNLKGHIIHLIDKEGNILEHYQNVEQIPSELKKGYNVFMQNPSCICIEVYTQYICVIKEGGKVDVIPSITHTN